MGKLHRVRFNGVMSVYFSERFRKKTIVLLLAAESMITTKTASSLSLSIGCVATLRPLVSSFNRIEKWPFFLDVKRPTGRVKIAEATATTYICI